MNLDFLDRVTDPERVPPGRTIESDAVVIGSGAGGAVAAFELQRAGLSVAILEEGPYLTGRDYGRASPLEAVRMLYRKGGLTFTVGNQSVLLPAGLCVGGTTVINSGTSLRALPQAVQRWRDEFGLTDLADHLDDTYARLEDAIGHAPVREEIFGKNGRIFREGAQRAGYRGAVLTRNERGCRGAGRCFLGCPDDAKQAMNVSIIPQALRAGARLYTHCPAKRVLIENGRAAGVLAPRGVTFRAPTIIVAAGAVYTPLLLRRTGARGRGLGRHLKMHPASRVFGLFDEEIRGWEGVPQGYHLEDTLREGISVEGIFLPPSLLGPVLPDFGPRHDALMQQYNRFAILGFRVIEDTEGRVFPSLSSWPILWYWLKRPDIDRLVKAAAISAEILFAAGARKVFTGIHGFEELSSPADLKRLREARVGASDLELSAYHVQGTARMADTPEKGVADPSGQVWGVPGLYVADASAMPSTPIVNPQLSIMAFATHVARGILSRAGRPIDERRPSHLPR
ncbi:MAG: GMC family oxidoreductase [Planctomycetes bacterium]|nr:GMC family oxidoreductase [Planctomycetota bacterium]